MCLWIWAPATPATHPRIVYLFGGGPPRPTRDPPRADATHTEELANRVERFDALRAPKNTSALRAHTHFRAHLMYDLCIWRRAAATRPRPAQSRRDPPRENRKSSRALRLASRAEMPARVAHRKITRASRAEQISARFAQLIRKRASRAVKCPRASRAEINICKSRRAFRRASRAEKCERASREKHNCALRAAKNAGALRALE